MCIRDRYYKWTQWIFLQLFNAYYDVAVQKARPIQELISTFEKEGGPGFSDKEWNAFNEKEKEDILMQHRLAYCAYGEVNWCEALGTVLANDCLLYTSRCV